jgi:hypothetical protein
MNEIETIKKAGIIVRLRNVYGTERVYPVCETARAFAEATGTTTLTRRHIEIIKRLGFTIEIEGVTL